MNAPDRIELIRSRLDRELTPTSLEIKDESHRHAGHAGARSGGGHFRVSIVSPVFTGIGPLARHRMVYAALGDAMGKEIHALSIQAKTPDETGSGQ